MTLNQTSKAVDSLPVWADGMIRACLVTDHPGVDTAKSLKAIAQKYKRMEEALKNAIRDLQLADKTVGKADLGSRGQTKACMKTAQRTLHEALAFDPLDSKPSTL